MNIVEDGTLVSRVRAFALAPADETARLNTELPQTEHNGLSMAFLYMASDNNNAFFADMIAKQFILNQNQDASKNIKGAWKKPPGSP